MLSLEDQANETDGTSGQIRINMTYSNTAIEITNVTKTFGKHVAVDELSLSVPQGSVYGFIGPNGSGKTTTLRMIMNILYPDSGQIRVFGEPLKSTLCDRIGYMPEERGIYRRMKVRELLQFLGSLKNGKDIARNVDRWLDRHSETGPGPD